MKAAPNVVLYWSNTMLDDVPNLDAQLKAAASSGFTTILLWSLHVNEPNPKYPDIVLGDLTWNDTLLVSSKTGKSVFDPTGAFTKLGDRLNALLDQGKVKKIFFSIGSEGIDFATIQKLYSTSEGQKLLQDNFCALHEGLGVVTGFDFDVEDCWDVASTAWLTGILATKLHSTISYCPFGRLDNFWEPCLESVFQAEKKQPVAWVNLQCYSGGSEDPLQWEAKIKANQKKNGVTDSSVFIVPGYPANNKEGDAPGFCPNQFTTKLKPYKGKVGGAFVWNTKNIFDIPAPCNGKMPTVQDYANAINKALQ